MNRWIKLNALAVILGLAPLSGLQAQLVCTGAACSSLPVSSAELDQIFYSLESQYLNEIIEDMSNASVYAGLQLSPSGVVNLREFTVGMQVVVGATEVRELDIYVPQYGVLEDMPSAGFAAAPRIFVGFNLGYMFSGEPHNWDQLGWFSLHRLDLYVSGLKMSLADMKEFAKPKENEDYGGFSTSIGAELRYHLLEGGDRESFLFAFTGVSVGVGYNRVEQKLEYTLANSKVNINAGSGTTIIWNAENRIMYQSQMDIFPVSIRTGFQFMYFLRLSLGAGAAWSKGSANLQLHRFGRAYPDSDYEAVLGVTLPDSYLDLTLNGSGGPTEPRHVFGTIGLEFNFPFAKIFVDAVGNRTNFSGSLGLRMVF